MRLIDANALAIDMVIEEAETPLVPWYPPNMPMRKTVGVSIEQINTAPTIDAIPRWVPCEEKLPKDLEVVNITWINHRPMTYYADIKDKPFTATAIHYRDKWWWYSPICEDLLAECGKSECDEMDADIEVTAWMPLPKPYVAERKDDETD